MPSKTIFETDRLNVRPWELADANAAFLIYSNGHVTRYLPKAAVEDVQRMRERIVKIQQRDAKWPKGMGSHASTLKSTGELIGNLLIKPLPDNEGNDTEKIEIGWHLAHGYWGQGFATEGARGLLKHGFETLGLQQLFAVMNPENLQSIKVAKRIRMKHLGHTDRYYGEWVELYLMTAEQWKTPQVSG